METKQTGARSFAVFVRELGDGDMNSELSEELYKLGNTLQDESLARNDEVSGSLTLKLKAKCDPRGVVHFVWDVKMEPPKPKRCGASVWVNKAGNFVHENPKQKELFPREIKIEDAEVREVGGDDAASTGREV